MQYSNGNQLPGNYEPPIEEFADGMYLGQSPDGRMPPQHYQQGQQMTASNGVEPHYDYKNHRNIRKIDGPVIPTEYSNPDLQRKSSEFSAILQQATAAVSMKRHESTFVMDISPSVVGWIIGRSGIRIKEIQSQTGCKMWVDQDVPNDQPRKIYFHGSKQSIESAVNRVNELVQAAPILSSNHVSSGKGLTSVIVDCPVSLVGLLIGKRGWTIKKIQQASNAQISINQSVREGLPRKIIVSGDEASVSTALRLITEVLRDKTLIGGDDVGHQLSMRSVSGNMPYDQHGFSAQALNGGYASHYSKGSNYNNMGGHAASPGVSHSPTAYAGVEHLRERYSHSPQPPYQQSGHGYHDPYMRRGQQQQAMQDPNRFHHGGHVSVGGHHEAFYKYGNSGHTNGHYSLPNDVQQRYHPSGDPGEHSPHQYAHHTSPNATEAVGQSFNATSSIFDFQHRTSPDDVSGQNHDQVQVPNQERDDVAN